MPRPCCVSMADVAFRVSGIRVYGVGFRGQCLLGFLRGVSMTAKKIKVRQKQAHDFDERPRLKDAGSGLKLVWSPHLRPATAIPSFGYLSMFSFWDVPIIRTVQNRHSRTPQDNPY